MVRNFNTHKIRRTMELSEKFWDFTPMQGSEAGKTRKLWVPGCWENEPGLESYRGTGIYETTFEASGTVKIEFKGVSHFARVFIDEEFVAEHYGSYTVFSAYKQNLSPGVHKLKVEVDNRFDEAYALDIPNDYYSYGGITRGVVLEFIPTVALEWVHVTPMVKTGDSWKVKVDIACRSFSSVEISRSLDISLAGTRICQMDVEIPSGENVVWSEEAELTGAESWNPEHPVLYEAEIRLIKDGEAEDDLIDRFGLRTVQVEGNQILLNGKKLRIKGFCRHEEHPQYGCALPAAAMQQDLKLIRDMGGNSVRTSHYPNDELFLDFCDELGILVWEENHARGLEEEQMRNPHFEAQCEQVIREMITTHYNHPSIYIWGILNECGSETEYGRGCYEAQYHMIAELDASRPYSSASCKYGNDLCQDLEQVCSWNMYPYWYDDDSATEKLERLHAWLQEPGRGAGKPLLVTEIGAGAVYGFRSRAKEVWSEELQKEILEKQLREVAAFPDCIGMYIWQFCDVRVSKEWAMRRPKSRNNKGIVDEYRRPKLAYEAVKQVFRSLPDYR